MSDGRILLRVYGDSLAMPRADEGVPYRATYAELVAEGLERETGRRVDLYNRAHGGQPVTTLFSEYGMDTVYFGKAGGDVLVLHLGIVDCAPRPIPNWFKSLISALPYRVRLPIVNFLHDNRARLMNAGLRFRVTRPERFAKTVATWLEKGARDFSRVYVVNIAPTTPEMEAHSPGLTAAIEEYNALLAAAVERSGAPNVRLVDVHSRVLAEDDGIETYINRTDGHHITAEGHRMYADAILGCEKAATGEERA